MADISKLMKQAQDMQKNMQKAQAELGDKEISGSAGAGMVEIKRNGHGDALKTILSKEATEGMSDDDREMLEDLITAAINDSQQKITAESRSAMGGGLGGFDLSGGLGDLFK